jgi:hypothetical protein
MGLSAVRPNDDVSLLADEVQHLLFLLRQHGALEETVDYFKCSPFKGTVTPV